MKHCEYAPWFLNNIFLITNLTISQLQLSRIQCPKFLAFQIYVVQTTMFNIKGQKWRFDVVYVECCLCWVSFMHSGIYAVSFMPSAVYAECHLCWVPFMQSAINAECHLCRVPLMLSAIYADCHLCWVSFMQGGVNAECLFIQSVVYAKCRFT